jgi:hypothetical protein
MRAGGGALRRKLAREMAAWQRCAAAPVVSALGVSLTLRAALRRCPRQARRGVPAEAQRLFFCGAAVADDVALGCAGVHRHATLRLSLLLRGAPSLPASRSARAIPAAAAR